MILEDIEPGIVDRIVRYRQSHGLTYRQLADRLVDYGLRINQGTIQKTEKSGRAIRISELVAYSRLLGVSVGELLGEPEPSRRGPDRDRLRKIAELSRQIEDLAG